MNSIFNFKGEDLSYTALIYTQGSYPKRSEDLSVTMDVAGFMLADTNDSKARLIKAQQTMIDTICNLDLSFRCRLPQKEVHTDPSTGLLLLRWPFSSDENTWEGAHVEWLWRISLSLFSAPFHYGQKESSAIGQSLTMTLKATLLSGLAT